jgi:hypothetical protein
LARETSLTLIWLGALLVFGGVLQMALSSAAERDFARDSATPGTRKTGQWLLGLNRIGLDLRWSRLAPLSCWPGLPSEFETGFGNSLKTLRAICRGFGAQGILATGKDWPYDFNLRSKVPDQPCQRDRNGRVAECSHSVRLPLNGGSLPDHLSGPARRLCTTRNDITPEAVSLCFR